MASRNGDDPSSRGAARSPRRAATWRSQACAFEQPDCHASLAMTAMGKLSLEEQPGVCEGPRRGDLRLARSNSQIATLRSQ